MRHRVLLGLLVPLAAALGFGGGCSSDTAQQPAPSPVCVPGTRVLCPCLSGVEGIQDCKEDASGYTACECPMGTGGGGEAGAGGLGGEGGATSMGGGGHDPRCDGRFCYFDRPCDCDTCNESQICMHGGCVDDGVCQSWEFMCPECQSGAGGGASSSSSGGAQPAGAGGAGGGTGGQGGG